MPETYYSRNKERVLARCKAYVAKNKEKHKANCKRWKLNNLDKNRISQWKLRGVIDGDFDLLNKVYEKETNCWICGVEYSKKRLKCLEHDHSIKDDDNVRYICCNVCNTKVVG